MAEINVTDPRSLEAAATEFAKDQLRYTRAAISAVELEAEILTLIRKWEEQNNGVVQSVTLQHQELKHSAHTVNVHAAATCILPQYPQIVKLN